MNVVTLQTNTTEETQRYAKQLGEILKPGDVLLLEGDLGAGKTTFTQGLAKGLEITNRVSSPTFTIIKEYEGRLPLYHMDVYRLGESEEDLGFDEYFFGQGVTVVEWAHLIEDFLPEEYISLSIFHSGEGRKIEIEPHGERYVKRVEEWLQ